MTKKYMSVEDMKAFEYIKTSREYIDYLDLHIRKVHLAYNVILAMLDGMPAINSVVDWGVIAEDTINHDVSKFSMEEFTQYRDYFYPLANETQKEMAANKKLMDIAWEHHKLNNRHHHESIQDENHVISMVIDWTAMGYVFGGTAQDWYEQNKEDIGMTQKHRDFLHIIFKELGK